ncbi:MAG: hypothetical protein J6S85_23440 [Methanobrevibacter sp.]|nr:hypothetical protein [Methanobrevibacter sp.]
MTYNTVSGLSAQVTITVVDPTPSTPTFFIDMDNSNDGNNSFYNSY